MMATPQDLEDFALGFSLTEGIVARRTRSASFEISRRTTGIELRMWLSEPTGAAPQRRAGGISPARPAAGSAASRASPRRCARRPVARRRRFTPRRDHARALEALRAAQALNRETRAVHAAAFWQPRRGLVALREDVGRHNALDKLVGALARGGIPARAGSSC